MLQVVGPPISELRLAPPACRLRVPTTALGRSQIGTSGLFREHGLIVFLGGNRSIIVKAFSSSQIEGGVIELRFGRRHRRAGRLDRLHPGPGVEFVHQRVCLGESSQDGTLLRVERIGVQLRQNLSGGHGIAFIDGNGFDFSGKVQNQITPMPSPYRARVGPRLHDRVDKPDFADVDRQRFDRIQNPAVCRRGAGE